MNTPESHLGGLSRAEWNALLVEDAETTRQLMIEAAQAEREAREAELFTQGRAEVFHPRKIYERYAGPLADPETLRSLSYAAVRYVVDQ